MDSAVTRRSVPAAENDQAVTFGTCIVCGAMLGSASIPGLRQCTSCRFVTADTRLSSEALTALYGKDYFHGTEYFDYVQERDSLRLNFHARMATIEAIAGPVAGKSVFEIGCAYGFFLELAREWGMTGRGIDIAADGVRYAREKLHVDALNGDYLSIDTEPADLIVMWDTVEHLPRPDLFIQKAAQQLKPGGALAITTGDIDSINARLRGRRWRMIHPPTHLHYFSSQTLARLIVDNGLDVVHVSHPGVSRRLHSVLYMTLVQRLGLRAPYTILSRLLPNLALTLNLFDIMFVVARKPDLPLENTRSWN